MVITSLNLLDSSIKYNPEMGLLINKDEDLKVYSDAKAEAEFIIKTAETIKTNKVLERENRKQMHVSDVLNADVGSSLKKSFPTFAKLFDSNKKRDK